MQRRQQRRAGRGLCRSGCRQLRGLSQVMPQVEARSWLITLWLPNVAAPLRTHLCAPLAWLQEEGNEFGGTFICNGIERIIRMLVQVRAGLVGWAGGLG